MVYRTLYAIKARPKIQLDNFILLFLCCLFGVDTMRVIPTVTVKEIVLTFSIYAANVYYNNEHNIPDFL